MASEKLLIDATPLVEDLELLAKHEDSLRQSVILGVVHKIKTQSSIDAVEVVRCKDCKYWQDNNDSYPHEECRWGHGETPDANDFCSYGERKEGAD